MNRRGRPSGRLGIPFGNSNLLLVDGKSTQDIRRAIMKEFGVSYHNADRLVRTEVSYVHNQTTLARYREMGQTQVSIMIVEDGKACDICKELPGKPYDIDSAPFLPAHPRCRCCYAPWTYLDRKRWAEEHPEEAVSNRPEAPEGSAATPKNLQTPAGNDILDAPDTKAGEENVHEICKIDRRIYSCITSDIPTDEVIITDERIEHSNLHNNAFEKYGKYVAQVLTDPDVIFEDDQVKTGIVVREIEDEGVNLEVVLRIRLSTDPEQFKNSVLSCWDIREKRLERYRRNRKILYIRPEL